MEIILAVLIGSLFAAGVYLLLRRSLIKLIIGLILLGHGANLLIFTMGRLTRGQPPLISGEATQLTGAFADPLPQALVLTAIVIGFGLQAFALILIRQFYQASGNEDVDTLKMTDAL